jgi:hypothetical protein
MANSSTANSAPTALTLQVRRRTGAPCSVHSSSPGGLRWPWPSAMATYRGGEPRQQQQRGDGVQRLVEGEGVVDGRRGAQVPGC